MSTYATTAQMTARFTEREVIALTDHDNTGAVDTVQLGNAIAAAGTEIDGRLGRRYVLPLAKNGVPMSSPPSLLVNLCCDIARYRLAGTEVQETDAMRARYKDALSVLDKLADGLMVFAEGPDLLASGAPNSAGAVVRANVRDRAFGSVLLDTY